MSFKRAALVLVGVLALFGVVVVSTAPRIVSNCGSMRGTKARADLLAIEEALEAYRSAHGEVPSTGEGIETLVHSQVSDFLTYVPMDPWGNSYHYTSDGVDYQLFSFGADGHPGGRDDDADIRLP